MNSKMFFTRRPSAAKLVASLPWLRRNTQCLTVGCLLAVVALTASACKSDYPAASAQQPPPGQETKEPRKVKTAQVARRPMERTVVVIGALAAYDQATLSVKVPGRLATITVDFASLVQKGQLIAQVEPRDYQLRVQQAEAATQQARARLGLSPDGTDDRVDPEQTGIVRQARALLEEARANRERSIKLLEETIISRARFDSDDAAYKVAQSRYQDSLEEVRNRQAILAQRRSELEIARQQLADTSLYAPFDGMIQERHASIGEYLAAGARIVTLVRMDPLRLRAEVPEREANDVRAGQPVRVTVEGDPNIYSGQVMRLSPVITAQNRILTVEAEVKNNGSLRPGSFARVEIVTEERNQVVAVPTSAVVTFAGIEKVILVKDGKAVEKPVSLGRRTAEWTEVVSGVAVGDTVVIEPGNLQTGQPVNVVQ